MGEVLDAAGLERAYFVGNSMGGRIGDRDGADACPTRVDRLVLLAPAMAWLRARPWAWLLRAVAAARAEPAPVPVEPIVRRIVPGGAAAGPPPAWTSSCAPT